MLKLPSFSAKLLVGLIVCVGLIASANFVVNSSIASSKDKSAAALDSNSVSQLLSKYEGQLPSYSESELATLMTIPKQTWRELMSSQQYHILWEKGTERAFTGELLNENRPGVFVSAGCRLPVFKSEHKFKSGTGWPSFWEVFDKDNIILKDDYSWLGIRRIEVLSKCGEHLGHVFEDGPPPTGLRYCINSAALDFVPTSKNSKSPIP